MSSHPYAKLLQEMQEKHAFLRTSRVMAIDPSAQFTLDKQVAELETQIEELLVQHPELRRAHGRQTGLRATTQGGELQAYFSELEVSPSTEIGPIHRVNCDRLKSVGLFWDSFLLDEDLHDYQVYLISACDTQMPEQFTERLLLEYLIDEEPSYPNYRTNNKRLLIETLPLKRNLRKSQQAFEAYIAERFDLQGDRDIEAFLSGDVANYDFDFVLLAFQTLEEDWKDFIPDYYRWIIKQFQRLSRGGPKFLLTFVHYARHLHRTEQTTDHHREIVSAFDAIDGEENLARHINRLAPVPATDLISWFQRVGVTNPNHRERLTEIVVAGLSPDERSRYEQNGIIDMADIDLAQDEIYQYLTR